MAGSVTRGGWRAAPGHPTGAGDWSPALQLQKSSFRPAPARLPALMCLVQWGDPTVMEAGGRIYCPPPAQDTRAF